MMNKIIRVIALLALVCIPACQTTEYIHSVYDKEGNLLEETIINKDGIPDWSDGKTFSVKPTASVIGV